MRAELMGQRIPKPAPPDRTNEISASHSFAAKLSAGPVLSFESRTRTVPSSAIRSATSTQLPVSPLLYDDLNHADSGAMSVEEM